MGKRVKPGSPLIAVAYIRVSKDDQKLGPEAQRASIEAWARSQGGQVAAFHVDQGVSSVTPIDQRPALVAALGSLREYGAGVLAVARRDRIARDPALTAAVERAVAMAGAVVLSAAGEGNGSTPADEFMRGVIDSASRYERALIRARTKGALAAKSAKGERISRHAPYGFALAMDGVHLAPVASEQTTIARARQLAEGRSLRAVAAQLAAEGHVSRAGRAFCASAVAKFLNFVPSPSESIT